MLGCIINEGNIKLTDESVRVGYLLPSAVPVEIEMFGHELDAEAEVNVLEVDTYKWLLVALGRGCFRDSQFSILEGDFLDIACLKDHLVIDVDPVLNGLESESGHVRFLVAVVVDDDSHGA